MFKLETLFLIITVITKNVALYLYNISSPLHYSEVFSFFVLLFFFFYQTEKLKSTFKGFFDS